MSTGVAKRLSVLDRFLKSILTKFALIKKQLIFLNIISIFIEMIK